MTLDAKHTYDPSWYVPLQRAEDQHFWFRARNEAIKSLLKRATVDLPEEYTFLEVGCGTGNVLRALKSATRGGTVVGLDLFIEGLYCARQRTVAPVVQGDIRYPPFRTGFNLVGLFDVLEHIPDDEQVLLSLFDLLLPGGKLLMTVPAHPFLWSYFDEASHHQRRYQLDELKDKLLSVGFQVDYITEYMISTLPFTFIRRYLNGQSVSDKEHQSTTYDTALKELRVIPVLNDILFSLLTLETRFIARQRKLPFGSSLLVLATRPA